MAYTFSFTIALGTADTGLTLRGQLADTTGANVGGTFTAGFVEVGAGVYSLTTSIPDAHRGFVVVMNDADGAKLAQGVINPEQGEQVAALASRLTSGRAALLDKLNVAGTLAHSGAAATYKADVSDLAQEATLATLQEAVVALESATPEEIEAAIAAAHGAGRYDGAGTLAIAATMTRILADEDLALLFIRGDTHLVDLTVRDAATGAAVDISDHELALTIKPRSARGDDDDTNAVCTIKGEIIDGPAGRMRFSIGADDTAPMALDEPYDYDVQGISGSTVTTFVRGKVRLTFDVTRGPVTEA